MSSHGSNAYYPFYPVEYRASRKVQRMNYVERGLYRELLDEQFLEGSLPNGLEALADICGCPLRVMEKAWPALAPCFQKEGDRLINSKLENLRTERDKIRVKRVESGRLGGKAKHMLANAKQKPVRREEKSRGEKAAKKDLPNHIPLEVVEDYDGLTPEMVAAAVLEDLRLSGRNLCAVLEDQCHMEMRAGSSAQAIRLAVVAAWRDYEQSKPKLQYTVGAEKFFGEIWRNKNAWPWKEGERTQVAAFVADEPVHEFQSRSIPLSEIRKSLGKEIMQ